MNPKSSAYTIGIDLGDRKHAVCVLDAEGAILKQETITNNFMGSWGFMIAEDIVGSPWPGDVAYLARLGPDHELMKVESVEGNQVKATRKGDLRIACPWRARGRRRSLVSWSSMDTADGFRRSLGACAPVRSLDLTRIGGGNRSFFFMDVEADVECGCRV